MSISPINGGVSSIVNMLNQRASSKTVQNSSQSNISTNLRKLIKSNPNQVDNKEYNKSYFDKKTNPAVVKQAYTGLNLANMSETQKITSGVGYQLSASETFMDVLQKSANYADLEIQYEKLVAEGSNDATTQQINERALAFYREMGSEQSMNEFIEMWRGFDFSKMYDNSTGGAVSRETNYILDDLSSLEYLGLDKLDQMTAAQRKEAIINAMDIVSARINETPWKTNKTYTQASQNELAKLDSHHYKSYATTVTVADIANAKVIGNADLKELLNGSRSRPDILPEANGETMTYYEYMKSMGVSITGRIDTRA